jgi:lycopene beta-cyclase
LLLNIIAQQPALTESIMCSLFKNNQFDDIFRFLDEESNLLQEMKIFSRLPWAPFIKTLFSGKLSLYETTTKNIDNHTEHNPVQYNRS